MGGTWEIRGLFGNEYAMELAIDELKKHKEFEWSVLDRRNLSVKFEKRDAETERVVRRVIDIYHGWVEHEGPLGQYDTMRAEEKRKKLKKDTERAKKQAKH